MQLLLRRPTGRDTAIFEGIQQHRTSTPAMHVFACPNVGMNRLSSKRVGVPAHMAEALYTVLCTKRQVRQVLSKDNAEFVY